MPRCSLADAMDDPPAVPLAKPDPQLECHEHVAEGPVWRHSDRVVFWQMADIIELNRSPVVL
jgi:hypothetical protein